MAPTLAEWQREWEAYRKRTEWLEAHQRQFAPTQFPGGKYLHPAAAPKRRDVLLVGRDGQRTITADRSDGGDWIRVAVAPVVLANPLEVDTPRDFDLETRTFRDSGARDPEGRRIFLEDGQPERALVAGPTLGYRAWLVKDGALWSTGAGKQRWGPGQPLAAVCVAKQVVTPDPRGFKLDVHFRSSHEGIPAPWRPCSCGVYAIRRREDLERVAGAGTIVGQVALWGHVIEHQRGYRAQYAYPVRLWAPAREGIVGTMVPLPPGFPHLRSEGERLADLYGVPWGAPPEGGSA